MFSDFCCFHAPPCCFVEYFSINMHKIRPHSRRITFMSSLESIWTEHTPGFVTRAGLWLETGSLGGWCQGRGPSQRWLAGAPRALWRSWSSSCGWRCVRSSCRSCCWRPQAGRRLRWRETAGSEFSDIFWRQPKKFIRSDNGDGHRSHWRDMVTILDNWRWTLGVHLLSLMPCNYVLPSNLTQIRYIKNRLTRCVRLSEVFLQNSIFCCPILNIILDLIIGRWSALYS